jgi:hypothetical protein
VAGRLQIGVLNHIDFNGSGNNYFSGVTYFRDGDAVAHGSIDGATGTIDVDGGLVCTSIDVGAGDIDTTGDINCNSLRVSDWTVFNFSGDNYLEGKTYFRDANGLAKGYFDGNTGAIEISEQTAPSAPASDKAVIFARDNGSGKTQLCVRFTTGAIQVIATEP